MSDCKPDLSNRMAKCPWTGRTIYCFSRFIDIVTPNHYHLRIPKGNGKPLLTLVRLASYLSLTEPSSARIIAELIFHR